MRTGLRAGAALAAAAVTIAAMPATATAAASEQAGCLGSLSSFGGPNHLRAPIQHALNESDQGAFISSVARARLGSHDACADYAFGG
jgi:hypothetical protein